jgi:hypothetical protein
MESNLEQPQNNDKKKAKEGEQAELSFKEEKTAGEQLDAFNEPEDDAKKDGEEDSAGHAYDREEKAEEEHGQDGI